MRKNEQHKTTGNGHGPQQVHVEFNHASATAVAIAGTFNNWRPEVTPMVALGDGRWRKDLALQPGTYEYLLVVDGQWLADPLAKETTPNPFGGVNSVVRVSGDAWVSGSTRRARRCRQPAKG